MNRRQFLALLGGSAASLTGCVKYWPHEGLSNPCLAAALPESLARHEVVVSAWEGIDPALFWDCHAHLTGIGDSASQAWLNPQMRSLAHPIKRVQLHFYMNAACVQEAAAVDTAYVARLHALMQAFPPQAKAMLLAFDFHHNARGAAGTELSPFYTPNEYAARIAHTYPERFEWIASIHPYRDDAVATLEWALRSGARAVKWLPAAMGIDPASAQCDAFYAALVRLRIPLLTHAGDEHAVDAAAAQALGNPLRLRRALDHGVRVIVAHCATLGSNVDLDKGEHGPRIPNIELFARMMNDPRHLDRLYGDISALTQINRDTTALETIFTHDEWHSRLVNGSDYPLPGVMPIFSPQYLTARGYITEPTAQVLSAVRRHNPLLFDFLLKRHMRIQGKRLAPAVFESRRVFASL